MQLVYYAYVGAAAIARAIPERWAYRLAGSAGAMQARLAKKKRGQVEKNLSRITGELPSSPTVQRLVVDAYRSYARYWLETFSLVMRDRDFFLERFDCPTQVRIDKVLARGKGAIVVVGHLGNWDAAGAWVGARGNRLVTLAEILKPRRMFDFFVEHRARLGMKIYPAQAGVTRDLVREIEEGAVVAILGDRDLKGTGPEVEWFGEPANLPAGPASIALRAGVPLLVAGVWGVRRPDGKPGWEAEISEPIELPDDHDPNHITREQITEMTRKYAAVLEGYVERRPEEWHVFQPFWPADKPAKKR
ncbi:MAG: phosphatidylinositol mannoside acyltransferase [Actinomycetota bacterium]